MGKQAKRKVDWIIHLVGNHTCDECQEEESGFIPGTCNAHTHGLEKYGHMDFQLVLAYPMDIIGYILNEFGERVQSGQKFKAGDMVEGIFLDCPVRLDEYEETGRTVLRVIVPDKNNIFPEDESCAEAYRYQLLNTEMLSNPGKFVS